MQAISIQISQRYNSAARIKSLNKYVTQQKKLLQEMQREQRKHTARRKKFASKSRVSNDEARDRSARNYFEQDSKSNSRRRGTGAHHQVASPIIERKRALSLVEEECSNAEESEVDEEVHEVKAKK